jgi:Ca2+-binding RTX toxin-like protein
MAAITGTSGNDTLISGAGDDTMDGGAGYDTASFANATAAVLVNLSTGTAWGGAGTDTLFNFEAIAGSAYGDSLIGDGTNNILIGGAGDDLLDGGDGLDAASYSDAPAGVQVDLTIGRSTGGAGNDQLARIEQLIGSAFDDSLLGDANANTLIGNAGADTLNGAAGLDQVDYSGAPAAVLVNLATGTASGGEGNDILLNIETVLGSVFNDTLIGDSANNTLLGQAGDDTLDGGAGFDTTSYQTALSAVTVDLATGLVSGGGGNDILLRIEQVTGSSFNDLLTGDNADNTLVGGMGNDQLNGAGGSDAVSYVNALGLVTVNLATGSASGADGSDTLSGIEQIHGSAYNDELIGDAGQNVLRGNGGDDRLDGGAGTLDTADYSNAPKAVVVNLVQGTATGGDGNDTVIGIEQLIGSAFADTLIGDATPNSFKGNGGDDQIDGGLGVDTVDYSGATSAVTVSLWENKATGPDGTDTLVSIEEVIGSAFSDTLTGNIESNTFIGGAGDDNLDGDNGLDFALYSAPKSSFTVVQYGIKTLLIGNGAGSEGSDSLIRVERLVFPDLSVALDMGTTQSGGQAALLIGAVLGRAALSAKPELVGDVIDLFDQGYSLQILAGAVMRLPIWGVLANSGQASASTTQIATYLLTTVNGQTPDAATLAGAVSALNNDPQGDYLWHLAASAANQTQIALTGLTQDGLVFT